MAAAIDEIILQSISSIRHEDGAIIIEMTEGNPKWQDVSQTIESSEELYDQLIHKYRHEFQLEFDVLQFREKLANWIENIDWNSSETHQRAATLLDDPECSTSIFIRRCCNDIKKNFAGNPINFIHAMSRCLAMEHQMISNMNNPADQFMVPVSEHDEIAANEEILGQDNATIYSLDTLQAYVREFTRDYQNRDEESQQRFIEYLAGWYAFKKACWDDNIDSAIKDWELQLRCPDLLPAPVNLVELQSNFNTLFQELIEGGKCLADVSSVSEVATVLRDIGELLHDMIQRCFIYERITLPVKIGILKCSGGSNSIRGVSVELRCLLNEEVCGKFTAKCTSYDLVYVSDQSKNPFAEPKSQFKGEFVNRNGTIKLNDLVLKTKRKRDLGLMESLSVLRVHIDMDFENELLVLNQNKFQFTCNFGSLIITSHPSQYEDAMAALIWDICSNGKGTGEFVYWRYLSRIMNWLHKDRCASKTAGRGLDQHQINFLKSKIPDVDVEDRDPQISWDQFYRKEDMKRHQKFQQQDPFSFWGWFYATLYLVQECLKDEWNDGLIAGYISKKAAEKILMEQPDGSFMLRFSESYVKYSPSYPYGALSAIFHHTKSSSAISADPYYFEELKKVRKSKCFGSLINKLVLVYEGAVIMHPLKTLVSHDEIKLPEPLEDAFADYMSPLGRDLCGYIQRISQKLLVTEGQDAQQGDSHSVRSTSMSPRSHPSPMPSFPVQNSPAAAVPATVSELSEPDDFCPTFWDPMLNTNNNCNYELFVDSILNKGEQKFIEEDLRNGHQLDLIQELYLSSNDHFMET